MSRSRLRPLDLALQIGQSFSDVDIHGDGLVEAHDKPQERIDGAPGPRHREWWHHYQYAFAEYQPVGLVVDAVNAQNPMLSRYYRRRARLSARLVYGVYDDVGNFVVDTPLVFDWVTLAQAERASFLRIDLARTQESEENSVVSAGGSEHEAAIDTIEYQLQAPRNWRVSDW